LKQTYKFNMMKRVTSRQTVALAAAILTLGIFLTARVTAAEQKLSDLAYAGHKVDAGTDVGIVNVDELKLIAL